VGIATVSEAPAGVGRILLGPGAAKTVGVDIAQTYPGGERAVVKRVGKDIVIAGNDAQVYQGTRHSLDMFLSELGCECFGPDPNWHVVPKTDEVGSYLTEKFKLHTSYSGEGKAVTPDKLKGLCAWFKVAPRTE